MFNKGQSALPWIQKGMTTKRNKLPNYHQNYAVWIRVILKRSMQVGEVLLEPTVRDAFGAPKESSKHEAQYVNVQKTRDASCRPDAH